MRYNATDNPPPIYPCDVLDADGVLVPGNIIHEFDTESGEIVCWIYNEDGSYKKAYAPEIGCCDSNGVDKTPQPPVFLDECPEIEVNGFKQREHVSLLKTDSTTGLLVPDPSVKNWTMRFLVERRFYKAPLTIVPYIPPVGV